MENKNKIPPERAIEILRRNGMDISIEQAGVILNFLFKLAEIAVNQLRKDEDRDSIYKSQHR